MIFAPSGYHEPPDGPETMRTKVSEAAGKLIKTSGTAARMTRASDFMIVLPRLFEFLMSASMAVQGRTDNPARQ
jgi:hypothetical protein